MRKVYRYLIAALLVWTVARCVAFHCALISFPYPLEVSEPAEGILAQGVAAGLSAGDLANIPLLPSHYGPLYGLLTGALCRFGLACDLQGQRALAGAFIAGILALLALACLRAGADWLETAAILVWAYALLIIHFTPVSRPDALGTLLFFAGLSVPFLCGYGALALAAAACFFTLAAVTKLYFLAGPLCLGTFLFWSRRRAFWIFFPIQSIGLAAAFFWLLTDYPYGFILSVLFQSQYNPYRLQHVLLQLWVILVLASPGFLPLAVAALVAVRRRLHRGDKTPMTWGAGLADGTEWLLYLGIGLLAFVAYLGGGYGALFTYLIQLAVLPGLVCFASACGRLGRWRPTVLALLTLNAVCSAHVAIHNGFDPGGSVRRNWDQAAALVAGARQPVVSADMDLSVQARGLPVFDTGLSDFAVLRNVHLSGLKKILFPHLEDVLARESAWQLRARTAMLDPRTDLVAVSDFSPIYFEDLLRSRFRPVRRIQLAYPQCAWATYWLEFYAPLHPLAHP